MKVSWNGGTPQSSILKGLSIINHPFWGTTIYGTPHILGPAWTCPWEPLPSVGRSGRNSWHLACRSGKNAVFRCTKQWNQTGNESHKQCPKWIKMGEVLSFKELVWSSIVLFSDSQWNFAMKCDCAHAARTVSKIVRHKQLLDIILCLFVSFTTNCLVSSSTTSGAGFGLLRQ